MRKQWSILKVKTDKKPDTSKRSESEEDCFSCSLLKKRGKKGSQGEYMKKLEHLAVMKTGVNCNNRLHWEGGVLLKMRGDRLHFIWDDKETGIKVM